MRFLLLSAVIALYIPAAHAEEFEKNGNPCLGGVCIGDDIFSVKGIKWERANVRGMKMVMLNGITERFVPQSASLATELAPFLLYAEFDGEVLSKLSKAKGFCASIEMSGKFKSESGLVTTVTINVDPSADGRTQTVRVQRITRKFPTNFTEAQMNDLYEQLKARYPSVAVGLDAPTNKPRWIFSRDEMLIGGATLRIEGPFFNYVDRKAKLETFPGCSTTAKID